MQNVNLLVGLDKKRWRINIVIRINALKILNVNAMFNIYHLRTVKIQAFNFNNLKTKASAR